MLLTENSAHHHHATAAITKHQPQQAIIVKNQQAEESTVITSNTNSDDKTIQDTSLMQNKSWMLALAGAFLVLAMFWYLLAVTLWFPNDSSIEKYISCVKQDCSQTCYPKMDGAETFVKKDFPQR